MHTLAVDKLRYIPLRSTVNCWALPVGVNRPRIPHFSREKDHRTTYAYDRCHLSFSVQYDDLV